MAEKTISQFIRGKIFPFEPKIHCEICPEQFQPLDVYMY